MKLLRLKLENVRSYPSLQLDLHGADVHVFQGKNGAGKTNLLEAIAMLSQLSSCRGADETVIPTFGADFFRVKAAVRSQNGETSDVEVVSVIQPRKQKACFINDVRVQPTEMLGFVPTVVFLPDDVQLFRGSPQERRRFLDNILLQVSPEYARAVAQYQRVLKQRNALLKAVANGTGNRETLLLWDGEIAEEGSKIAVARLELLATLGMTVLGETRSLGEAWSSVELRYLRKGTATERRAIREEYREQLLRHRDRDILLQATTAGPHREDWQVIVDGRPLPDIASRGQERAMLLALLFLEVSYLQLQRGEPPIVLLDDVFSELDRDHQEALLASFKGNHVFITTARAIDVPSGILRWDVKPGSVLPAVSSVVA